MPLTLNTAGLTALFGAAPIFVLAVDDDDTVREFVNSSVNTNAQPTDDTMVVDVEVTIGSKNWNGVSRKYFETEADGAFGYNGVRWATGDGRTIPAGSASGFSLIIVCAGMSAGNSTQTIVGLSGVTNGVRRNASGKGEINFGAPGAATTTSLPVDGSSFAVIFDHNGHVSHQDSRAAYYPEGGDLTIEATATQGELGGNNPLTSIGGDNDGNGNQPGKYHLICAVPNEVLEDVALEDLETMLDDWHTTFFAEPEPPTPGTVVNSTARLSGGASNYTYDASIGAGKSPRALLSDVLNNLFDPIQPAEATAGRTDYRCLYLHNPESGPLEDVEVYISASPAHATMTIGLDPAGVNGTAASPANETTAPAGVTFSAPASGSPLVIGDIPAGEHQAIWIRRVTAASSTFSRNESLTITVRGDAVPATKSYVLRHSVLDAETRTWRAIGTNKLEDVDPDPDNSEPYAGSDGFDAIILSWCTAWLRQTESVIEYGTGPGGGHGNYSGNCMAKFSLDFSGPAPNGTWSLIFPVTTAADEIPPAQHSYDSIDYDRLNDGVFLSSLQAVGAAADGSTSSYRYDLATNLWVAGLPTAGPQNPNGGGVGGSNETRCVWLTGQDKFWYEPNASRGNYAYYDPATDTWGDYIAGNDTDSETTVAVYDHRRHMVYGLGGQASSQIHKWDLGPATVGTKQATSGDDAAAITASNTAGYAYDILTDTVVAWDGGQALKDMAPATYVWTDRTLPAQDTTPTEPTANGTFKRFRHIEPCTQMPRGGYIVVNDITEDVYLFAADAQEEGGSSDAAIFRNLPLTWWTK